MAQEKPLSLKTDLTAHPAHLITGPRAQVIDALTAWLQHFWCPQKGCQQCPICTNLKATIHHQLFWARPDPNYNLEQIDEIIAHTSLMVDQHQDFFIVLEQAETLSAACGNRLLKVLEEPPHGYHFILLSERPRALLQTLHSRCLHTPLASDGSNADEHPLVSYFSKLQMSEPDQFLKLIDEQDMNEKEAFDLIDTLLIHWIGQHKKNLLNNEEKKAIQSGKLIELFKNALEKPPMPGGVKIFWKNVYLKANNFG